MKITNILRFHSMRVQLLSGLLIMLGSGQPLAVRAIQGRTVTHQKSQNDFARGVQLQQSGDLEGARQAYEAALKWAPRRVDALSNLGLVFSRMGQYEQAIRLYLKALAIDPQLQLVRYQLAATCFQAQKYEASMEELKKVLLAQAANPQARHLLAICLLKLNRLDEGIAELEQVQVAHPENLAMASTLGSAYITNQQLEKAAVLIEKTFNQPTTAEAYLVRGSYNIALADYRNAIEELSHAKELNPKLPTVRSQLGYAYWYVGDRGQGRQEFQAELEDNPQDFNANAFLGWLYREDGRLEEAAVLLKRAQQLKPDDSGILLQLAGLAQSRGLKGEALNLLERVVEQKPDCTPAHVLLAQMYFRLKRTTEARREREIIDRLNAEEQSRQPSTHDRQDRYTGISVPPR